jgi:hypothetical protein
MLIYIYRGLKLRIDVQRAASEQFLRMIFVPRAQAAGADVEAIMLHTDVEGSSNIGATICEYVEIHRSVADCP